MSDNPTGLPPALLDQRYFCLSNERPDDCLNDVLAERPLTPEEARAVLESTLAALQHLHSNGYLYGDFRPANIVAVNGDIKLTTASLKPFPEAQPDAKVAVAAEIRQIGQAVLKMLKPQGTATAGDPLPAPYASIVRVSLAASEHWWPTPGELLTILDGGPAPEPPPLPEGVRAAHSVPPQVEEPVGASHQSTRARTYDSPPPASSKAAVVVAGVLAALVLVWVLMSRTSESSSAGVVDQTRSRETPRESVNRPSPVAPTPAPPQSPVKRSTQAPAQRSVAAPPVRTEPQVARAGATDRSSGQNWGVVAAIYKDHDAAQRRASQLAKTWNGGTVQVLPQQKDARRYMVVLGTGMSRDEAERLRSQARSAGMPRDSYVTKLSF